MRLSNVSFRYARKNPWILQGIHLELPPGKVIEVTGRNGAGKSTLLRLLAGVVPPTRGAIAARPPVVGYAPETFPAAQPFTVTAYLRHMARIRGAAFSDIGAWAERLGMSHLLAVPLTELSKGSAHKVGLVQALLRPPGLLILDEPFAGLDAQTRPELSAIVREVAGNGGVVVVSDHQNVLRDMPAASHWTVKDGTVSETAKIEEARPKEIIELVVEAGDAADIERKLRADGYEVRVRRRA
jgi:ABC-type multidrug transport system ATPase subunit